jgi:uncharacterized protein (DUF433 family)
MKEDSLLSTIIGKRYYKFDIILKVVANMAQNLNRITFSHDIMGGQACIRDIRVPVSLIINLIANGASFSDILHDYEYLEEEDIKQSLQYASWTTSDQVLVI